MDINLLLRAEITESRDMVPEEMRKSPTFWVEHVSDESVLTDEWRVLPSMVFGVEHRYSLNPCPLYDHLRGLLDQGYRWTWIVEKRIDWMMLEHYYNSEKQNGAWDIDLGEFII